MANEIAIYRAVIRAMKDYDAAKQRVADAEEYIRENYGPAEEMEGMAADVVAARKALEDLGQ